MVACGSVVLAGIERNVLHEVHRMKAILQACFHPLLTKELVLGQGPMNPKCTGWSRTLGRVKQTYIMHIHIKQTCARPLVPMSTSKSSFC